MHASALLEHLDDLSREAAERWVAAALAEAAALAAHDDRLYPTRDDRAQLATAHQLHAAWRRWADDAEALLARLRPLRDGGHRIAGAHDLDYLIGRAEALLTRSPEVMLARHEQARRGDVLTGEEVRRELRLPDRR